MEARGTRYCFLITSAVFAMGIAYRLRNTFTDDAYIILNYARSLSTHGVWANTGEVPQNGVTSVLYVLFLALGGKIGLDIEYLAVVLNILFWGLWGGLTFWILLIATEDNWLSFVGTMAALTFPHFSTVFGMEGQMLISFQLLFLICYFRGAPLLAGFFMGLAYLTRPDSVIALAACALCAILYGQARMIWRMGLSFVLTLVPWFICSFWIFGSIFPGTLAGKQAQGASGFWPGPFWDFFRATVWGYCHADAWLYTMCFMLVPVAAYQALWRRKDLNPALVQLVIISVLYGAVYLAAYAFILGVAPYSWYFTTVFYFGIVALCLLISCICASSTNGAIVGLAALLALVAFQVNRHDALLVTKPIDSRSAVYRKVADYMAENVSPESTVGMEEVGEIPWRSKRKAADFASLSGGKWADYLRRRDFGMWLVEAQPEWLLLQGKDFNIARATLCQWWRDVPWFNKAYEQANTWSGNGEELTLYRKRLGYDEAVEASGIPLLAVSLDHANDLKALGVSPVTRRRLTQAKTIGELTVRHCGVATPATESSQSSEGPKKSGERACAQIEDFGRFRGAGSSGRSFLWLEMKAYPERPWRFPDCCGKAAIVERRPQTGNHAALCFRVALDGRSHHYYIPLARAGRPVELSDVESVKITVNGRQCRFRIEKALLKELDR